MPLTKNLNAYEDVRRVLDAIAAAGGGYYELSSAKAAHSFRIRANYFRKLLVERDGFSPYDALIFRIQKSKPKCVKIEHRTYDNGVIKSLEGDEIQPAEELAILPLDFDEDAITAEAESLAKRIARGEIDLED